MANFGFPPCMKNGTRKMGIGIIFGESTIATVLGMGSTCPCLACASLSDASSGWNHGFASSKSFVSSHTMGGTP